MAHPDPPRRRGPEPACAGPVSETAGCADPGGRQPLSCDRIVEAAVRYVDHDCLDGLSMRRLGAELGVEAMSLYRYFPSKAALLDAVVGRMLSNVVAPDDAAGLDWEPAVRAYARSFRAATTAHPRLLPLLATLGPGDPTLIAIERRMTALWRAAGFDARQAADAQAALQAYLTGWCLREQAAAEPADAGFEAGLDALLVGLRARSPGVP